MKRFFLFLMGAMFSVMAVYGQELGDINQKIKRYFVTQPDSAVVYLHQRLQYRRELSDSLLIRTYLSLGMSYGQMNRIDSAFYYYHKAIKEASGLVLLKGTAYYDIAQRHRFMGQFDRGLSALDSAEKYFKQGNSPQRIGMVLTDRGTIYRYQGKAAASVEILKKAIRYFKKEKNITYIIYARQELANSYVQNKKYEFAVQLYDKYLPEIKETNSVNYYHTLLNYGQALGGTGAWDTAEKQYKKVLRFARDKGHEALYYYALNRLGKVALQKQQPVRAAGRYKKAFDGLMKLHSHRIIDVGSGYLEALIAQKKYAEAMPVIKRMRKRLAQQPAQNPRQEIRFLDLQKFLYAKSGDYQKAYARAKHLATLKDSLQTIKQQKRLNQQQAGYESKYRAQQNLILTQNLALSRKKNRFKRDVILGISGLVLLLLIGGWWIYRKQRKENRLKRESLKNLKEKMRAERLLFKERKQSLARSKRELIANSLQIAKLRKVINDLAKDCGQEKEISPEVYKKLRRLGRENEDPWNFFMKKFVEVDPGFGRRLKQEHPPLTDKDINFCAMIKLRLSNKEIGTLLNIQHESVITKKYRLRKKMELPSKDPSLQAYLAQY